MPSVRCLLASVGQGPQWALGLALPLSRLEGRSLEPLEPNYQSFELPQGDQRASAMTKAQLGLIPIPDSLVPRGKPASLGIPGKEDPAGGR